MLNKEQYATISKITERADQLGLLHFDRLSLSMDLECATIEFNLRLDDLLNADDFNFAHDIIGIQNHINRAAGGTFDGTFVPRFSSSK